MMATLGAGPSYSERMTLYVVTKQLGISQRSAAAKRYQDPLRAGCICSNARVNAMCPPLYEPCRCVHEQAPTCAAANSKEQT